jgi:TRAP-type C4-dicarboxylate transport system permease small subunit
MEPSAKEILEETLEISKENNKMLRKMRSAMRWSRAFKVVYWIVIVGSMIGAFYYFQPLIDNLTSTYNSLMSSIGRVHDVGNSIPNVGSLLKK